VYSPNGITITFSRQTTKFFYADRVRIMSYHRFLHKNSEYTPYFDLSCSSYQLPSDGNGLMVFVAEEKGFHRIYRDEGRILFRSVTSGFTDISPTLTKDGFRCAFLRSNFGMPAALLKMDFYKEPLHLDHFNDALRAEWDLGKVDNITYKGADNDDVQM